MATKTKARVRPGGTSGDGEPSHQPSPERTVKVGDSGPEFNMEARVDTAREPVEELVPPAGASGEGEEGECSPGRTVDIGVPGQEFNLDGRTAAARERVTALRAERMKAALSGEKFDHASLRDAEDELAALSDAAGEKVRQARRAAVEAEAERAVRLKAEISALEDQRRGAIEEAEALARGMADAIRRADEARAGERARLQELGVRWPGSLDPVRTVPPALDVPVCGAQGGLGWGVLGQSAALGGQQGGAGGVAGRREAHNRGGEGGNGDEPVRTKKLEIDPANMIRDREGQITTTWFVRLPQGMITDDTKDPAIWKAAQQSRGKVMRRHDEVYAVGYDEDFAIIARVVDATRDAAVLGITKIVTFPERITPAFNDGTYRVRWAGTGYQVERIKDGARMGPVHGSEALAIRHVQALYPTPVG